MPNHPRKKAPRPPTPEVLLSLNPILMQVMAGAVGTNPRDIAEHLGDSTVAGFLEEFAS